MHKYLFVLFSLLLTHLSAQTYIPGQSYFSPDGYIEYIAGNFPVIITVPHGGTMMPASIPDRTCPDATTVNDLNTEVLGRQIDSAFFQRYGCHPHLIINRLARIKLDANREIGEAACGNAIAEGAWYNFHSFVEMAKSQVDSIYGKGLYIDLHGHAHSVQRLELGYLLTRAELALEDSILNQPAYAGDNSIKNLALDNLHDQSFAELLNGPMALGSLLADRGYISVPSEDDPYPIMSQPYFNGGYNTVRHGSRDSGHIDAIQIECNYYGVRNNYNNRKAFSDSLTVAIGKYLEYYYFGEVLEPTIIGIDDVNNCSTYTYSVPYFPESTYAWQVTNGTILSGQGSATVEVSWQQEISGCISVTRLCD